eukprot:TRINITY_DN4728_c0_g1_i1.p1 TRINITY_DN4728_c0_g1~~TRINITY_DN4728_c0_g1_i1.p1  ORF type:complete len:371 (+),score=13.09 TRINITY_DN4728_c0_g1_i1:32-1144(+)
MYNFGKLYEEECVKQDIAPRPELDELENPTRLLLHGNCPERFEDRINDGEAKAIFKGLYSSDCLVAELDLSYNFIGDEPMQDLAQALRHSNVIERVNLAFNNVTGVGARLLADGLMMNTSVLHFSIQGNDIGEEGGTAMAAMLKGNNTLQTLNLGSCGIKTGTIIGLATALQEQPSLTSLNIDKPLLPGLQENLTAAQHLGEMIKLNSTLTEINMSRFKMNDEMMQLMTPAFIHNQSVIAMNFSCNQLSVDCGALFASILSKRPDITDLNLHSNKLADAGVKQIAQALKTHPSLVKLDLRKNSVAEIGMSAVADMLKFNDSVNELQLWGNTFTPQTCKRFYGINARLSSLLLVDFDFHVVDGQPQVFLKD